MTQRAIVDLPQPDSPTTPSVSPCRTVKLTSSTAFTAPICFWKMIPRVTGKYFFRFSTTSSSSPKPSPFDACGQVPPWSLLPGRRCSCGGRLRSRHRRVLRRPDLPTGLLVEPAAEEVVGPWTPARAPAARCRQTSIANSQRGLKRTARGRPQERGRLAGICCSRSWIHVQLAAATRAGPRCRACCGSCEQVVDGCAARRPRPPYMTTTSLAISATTPRSCVIMMIAHANSLLQVVHQLQDLRLGRHVERRGRLVGDQRARGLLISAIAIITRWRMPPENWCG